MRVSPGTHIWGHDLICVAGIPACKTSRDFTWAHDTVAGASTTVALYDASGAFPECSEGPSSYMINCSLVSDAFFYFRAVRPRVSFEKLCADLNPRNELVLKADPVFQQMAVYWPGGALDFFKNQTEYLITHGSLAPFLDRLAKGNSACV